MVEDSVLYGTSVVNYVLIKPEYQRLGKWYRSKGMRGGDNPFRSYLMNKIWTLEEEFNQHMLRFQQVTFQ